MTNQDTLNVVQLLHDNPFEFYTGLSAYKKGFSTTNKNLYSLYCLYNEDVLNHIIKQTPHLLEHYTNFEGKLKKDIGINISRNIKLFCDTIIREDIKEDTLSTYALVFNDMSKELKNKFYSLINNNNLKIIKSHKMILPNQYIKEEFLLPYTNYIACTEHYLNFLQSYDNAVFFFNNFERVTPINREILEIYLLNNITIISKESAMSMFERGISISTIIVYKPALIKYLLKEINTLGEFKLLLNTLNYDTDINLIKDIKDNFPDYKKVIDDRLTDIINN
jgi:hypothetical protein